MIHEILVHFWNNPEKTGLQESKLLELQDFMHPGEMKLFLHIMEIAASYHWIARFCKRVQNRNENINSCTNIEVQPGLYIEAFATGIYAVLGDYRSEIVRLEELFLQNPELSLTSTLSSLEKYQGLFQVLKSMIEVVQNDHLYGCLLMGRLHKYIYCGIDVIGNAADKITKSIHAIFYRHLCNWIIYGDLVDNHNEFFICDGKCDDENFLYPEQIEEGSGSHALLKNRRKRPPPVRKFFINWNMVPMFINRDTAESILFMGRIVWIVRNDPKKASDAHYQTNYRRDVWEGRDIEFYKKIQALETQTFNAVHFHQAIEECRIKLTKYLWSVMLEEGKLKEHLQLIRDYYALGRGELFHQFIMVAENHIKNVSSDRSAHNLNFVFLETARKIYGESDKTYQRFELSTTKSEVTSSNPWSRLQLNFEINWPLHIIFHPKSMELYNKLFCYLLRLRKTQIDLHKLWQLHVSEKQNIDSRVRTLRQHLTFLVNNLQYYLQVDVIEAEFCILMKAVENANEFEDIIKVHHEFISSLLAKTFVLTPDEGQTYKNKHSLHQMPAVQFNVPSKVYNVITRLLELCDEFCLVARTWESVLTEPEIHEVEEFQKRTDIVVESLLFILYSLHEKAKGQHLLQLLYQLDFNRFFSKNKPDFNITGSY